MEIGVGTPRWAPAVPALQAGVISVYALTLWLLQDLPEWWFAALIYGSPLIFGGAWGLGWVVQRRRGTHKPDGGEYMTATFGNVLMGLGALLGAALLVWMLTFPPID